MSKKVLLLIASVLVSSIGAAAQELILKEETLQEVRYVVTEPKGAVTTYVYGKGNKRYCSFVKDNTGTPVFSTISVGEESERGFDFYEHLLLEQQSRNWSNISKHSRQGIIIYQAMQNGKPGHEILAIDNKAENKRNCWELVKGYKTELTREKEKKVLRLLAQRYQQEQEKKEQL